jgi:SSS family solute:Na+ symporter
MGTAALLWTVLLVYGVVLWRIAPRADAVDGFYGGRGTGGREIGTGLLVATVVISWIFAKSITNAANLGRSYGLVGAVAYAGWYLSIPVAGLVIYWIRTRTRASSLPGFVASRYGRLAGLAFLLVVLVRLMNEVWSNTAVVGAYFGASGTASYFAGALAFTSITLAYSLRGGLRGSILTDLLQFGLGVFLLVFVLAVLVPRTGARPLLVSGSWTLAGGVDLLLVALLQSFSYPFHDPVLTDRAFLTRPRAMLKGYLLAGAIAAAFIVLFGLVGVYGRVVEIGASQDTPLRVAEAFGVALLTAMTVLMMASAGSTLDSTLSSFSKALILDLGSTDDAGTLAWPAAHRWLRDRDPVAMGRAVMVLAVILGSLPLFTDAAIIKATTVSGTMVLGLTPAFLLFAWPWAGSLAFHMGFWPGVVLGILHALNRIPSSWALGEGPYAKLLGANVWGCAFVFGGFAVGAMLDGRLHPAPRPKVPPLRHVTHHRSATDV